MDLVAWLRGLGLERYAPAFRDNDVDDEILRELTSDDLINIGVTSVGHRRKLLAAIARLSGEKSVATETGVTHDAPEPTSTRAERRQLTVMFCDVVGSTALSARLDPEDLSELIRSYQACVATTIARFDGFIARYVGDGVLAYFGYPQAHEDDAERAVRAALAVIAAIDEAPTLSQTVRVRIGIATGLVVVGEPIGAGDARQQTAIGETPNLAARMQTLAEPDTVVVAGATRRLIGDLFEYRDLGTVELKGISRPSRAWQILGESAVASRFEALRGSALTPLVGRDEEIDLLLSRWARAKAGDGQVVLISGEPGIGKSRMTAALEERLHAEPHLRLRCFCSPYHQDSPLYPFIDQLGRAAEFARDDPPSVRLEKLETLLARAAPPDEDVTFLADLLSLPVSQCSPLANVSPQRKKERTLEALIRQLEGLASRQAVIMVFEDAHWADPTSRELLDLIVDRIRDLPVLSIVTSRPEFRAPWPGQPQVTVLSLNRLDRRDRAVLVGRIAGDIILPDAIIEEIVERTDGVPLFVEELTKSVLESGTPLLGIPATLHDSLMARLDRLASVRLVAQIGAAIGRQFTQALLRIVSRIPDDELNAALARLVASGLIFQRGTPPDAIYSFKHALVQDAAHGSLLRSARQQMHARIAEALEIHHPEIMDRQPELLAQHYAEAGLVEKSVACWGRAGHNSAARSAMAEAAAQLQQGLDQLALLPNTPEHQRQALELRSELGVALNACKGYSAPETGQAYARARTLWEQLGAPSEFLRIPYLQSRYHAYCGELGLALRLDEDLLELSRDRNDVAGLILANQSSGQNLGFAGRFAASRSHLEAVLALYDPTAHSSLAQQGGLNPHALSQAYLGNVLCCLGYPEQALVHSNRAIAEARGLAHQPTLAGCLAIGVRLLSFIEDDAALQQRAEQLTAVATEQGFPAWRIQGAIYQGWVKVKKGDVMEGISMLRRGACAYRAPGSELLVPHYFALLAEAYEIAGQFQEALTLLDDALRIVEKTGERWLAAELNRHKGQLLLRQGQSGAAEVLYCNALSTAEEQDAKLWELRAAASLAQLRSEQGRRSEARDLLAPVFGWFTEGFAMADLIKARTLLNELGYPDVNMTSTSAR
jgi:class 3 adenylate cyclase/predicted ATPase